MSFIDGYEKARPKGYSPVAAAGTEPTNEEDAPDIAEWAICEEAGEGRYAGHEKAEGDEHEHPHGRYRKGRED